jgi:hypothetical protein
MGGVRREAGTLSDARRARRAWQKRVRPCSIVVLLDRTQADLFAPPDGQALEGITEDSLGTLVFQMSLGV